MNDSLNSPWYDLYKNSGVEFTRYIMTEDINIIVRAWYVAEHLFWGIIAYIWYKPLFRCVEGLSLKEPRLVFIVFLVGACLLGIFIEIGSGESNSGVILNLVIGFGMYTDLTYLSVRRKFIIVTLTIALLFSALFYFLTVLRKI